MRSIRFPEVKIVLTDVEMARFWSHVNKTETCWLWTASLYPGGYGQVNIRQKHYVAHRIAYVIAYGSVPEGVEIDHVSTRGCTNRHCVNPAHLEAVSKQENIRRGRAGLVNNRCAEKTHCAKGHPFAGDNLIQTSTQRVCRQCRDDRSRRSWLKKRVSQ